MIFRSVFIGRSRSLSVFDVAQRLESLLVLGGQGLVVAAGLLQAGARGHQLRAHRLERLRLRRPHFVRLVPQPEEPATCPRLRGAAALVREGTAGSSGPTPTPRSPTRDKAADLAAGASRGL